MFYKLLFIQLEYTLRTDWVKLSIQAARPRYARSYNLHSGLRPSLVLKHTPFQMICRLYLTTVEPDSN